MTSYFHQQVIILRLAQKVSKTFALFRIQQTASLRAICACLCAPWPMRDSGSLAFLGINHKAINAEINSSAGGTNAKMNDRQNGRKKQERCCPPVESTKTKSQMWANAIGVVRINVP